MIIKVVTPFEERDWQWFGKDFAGVAWEINNLALFGRRPWIWFFAALRFAKSLRDGDVVISHHPYMTFYLAVAILLLRVKVRHYGFSFNHGNGRFLKGITKRIAIIAFRSIDSFVVFSEQEKEIYGKYYKIPLNKFGFVHWAVRSPEVDDEILKDLGIQGPYVCCMGRNNRDFGIFVEAVRQLGIRGVIVCKKGQLEGISLPDTIQVFCDIPMKSAMTILAGAQVSVTVLKDASTGAGHITVVSAMQLGIPQVLTRLSTVGDYFIDGVHGLFVNQGDVSSLKGALSTILDSQELRLRIAAQAREFARHWFSEEASKRHLESYIRCIQAHESPPSKPEGWSPIQSPG